MPKKLSPKEEMFVNYLFEENMNRTRAYMRLHPKASYDSARTLAPRLFAKTGIQAEIARRLDEDAMSAVEAIARLSQIARGTILHFLKKGPDGFFYFNLNNPEAEDHMFLIKELETKRQRRIVGSGEQEEEWEEEWVRLKLHSAYDALVDILKLYGKFAVKVDLTAGVRLQLDVDHEGFDRSMKTLAETLISTLQQDGSADR